MAAFSGQGIAASFGYNGLGDRLQQTVNSVTTNYTLDLASGLTQVLADDTHSYLYGVERMAQHGGAGVNTLALLRNAWATRWAR